MSLNLNTAAKQARPFEPSPQQAAYFDWIETGTGNAILEAVAGAGKTTTLLEGISRMSGRIWFGVYNKKMSDEIKAKVSRRADIRERRGIYVSTFHSAGFSALQFAFKRSARLEVTDRKVSRIISQMQREEIAEGRKDNADLLADYADSAAACVSMAKNRGIGAITPDTDDIWLEMIEHFNLAKDLPQGSDLDTLIGMSRDILARSSADLDTIDFDDMIFLPLLKKLRMLKHEWVIVDEAQDTNPSRRALAAELLAPGGRFVAVGDPHQAIFGFTGADNDSLKQLQDTFGCKVLELTVTYRCPKAVVDQARAYVSHITAHESAPEGSYRRIDSDEISGEVASWEPHDYSKIAILCRVNAPLVRICFSMLRQNIPAKIEGRDIGAMLIKTINRFKAESTDVLRYKLEEWFDRERIASIEKDEPSRLARAQDQFETIMVLIEIAESRGGHTSDAVCDVIRGLFDDDVSGRGIVTLCSAHKSKGLEWDRVYIYGRSKYMPHPMARKEWEQEQEANLIYVAITRAMSELVDIEIID